MELKNVSSSYKNELIYEKLNFTFDETGMTFIKGDSGTGKSTLLNILYGIKDFDGEYIIPEEITKFRRNHMAYIFQDFKIKDDLTVIENIELHLKIKDIPINDTYVDELLNNVDMLRNKHKVAGVLSGGEKQRLAIVRALVTKPSILLCDEPTGNLDEETSLEIFDILKGISQDKLVIVASHSMMLIDRYADRVYKVEDKNLLEVKRIPCSKLIIGSNKYGKLHFKEIIKMGVKNYIANAIKLNLIFVAFALFASIFLVLNFSKGSFDNSLTEKYQEYDSRKSFVVDVWGYSSIREFDEFIEKFGYDNYFVSLMYNNSYPSGLSKGMGRHVVSYNPGYQFRNYANEFTENKNGFEFTGHAYAFLVNDFDFLGQYLVHGRLPQTEDENLINTEALELIIDEHNSKMADQNEDFVALNLSEMSTEEVVKFLDSNDISIGLENRIYEELYTKEAVIGYKYKVVGVIDDQDFRFDNYPLNLEVEDVRNFRKDNYNMYLSTGNMFKQFQLMTRNFDDLSRSYWNNDPYVKTLTPEEVLAEDIDFYDKEIFKMIMVYDEEVDSNQYLEKISKMSEDKKIDEIKFHEFYFDISEDKSNQENVNKYIVQYSIYILVIGFLTAFIGYIRFNIKRNKEYQMYELLGMEEKEKFSVFMFELFLTIVNFAVLIGLFFAGFSVFLTDIIERTVGTLIYKSRDYILSYTFDPISILVLLLLVVPFVLSYKVHKRKLVK